MSHQCSICTDVRRFEIDAAIQSGAPNRHIARQFALAEASVRRHRKTHLMMMESTQALPSAIEPPQEDPAEQLVPWEWRYHQLMKIGVPERLACEEARREYEERRPPDPVWESAHILRRTF